VVVGFGAGVITVYLLFLYEAWRVRMMRRYIAKTTDEWADAEARALEAAEEILRGSNHE
jgi:hypothetical protein